MSSEFDGSKTTPVAPSELEQLRRARERAASVILLLYYRDGAEAVALGPGSSVTVGRGPSTDVALDDASLSRRHARFTLAAEGVVVEDLGSTNGTWVQGKRVDRAVVTAADDVLLGGVSVSLRFRTGGGEELAGVESHDRFVAALEHEVARARFYNRPLALVMVRACSPSGLLLSRFCPEVQERVRPVDRIAIYAPDMVEILAPELAEAGARERALGIVRAIGAGLVAGVAIYPDAATSAEALLDAARVAAASGTASDPVIVAQPPERYRVAPKLGTAPVAASPAMKELFETVDRVARAQIPVLLLGETGSGKEVVARALHARSHRADAPLLFVNCGAIPSQLVESTLFGHEKGAFTGAAQQQKGVFEAAHGGTVLLDEVGELPAPAQAALLRVLETKHVLRVGSTRELPVDLRVVAATHRNLEAMCEAGAFRVDLMYRLNAMTLKVPPLRERRVDIEPLSRLFLGQAAEANGSPIRELEPDALEALERYTWPGNVRELKNCIERAVVIARGDAIALEDLPDRVRAAVEAAGEPSPQGRLSEPDTIEDDGATSFKEAVQRFEARLIVEALRATAWSQTAAAKKLDMPLRTLIHKMKTYGIQKLGYRESGSR